MKSLLSYIGKKDKLDISKYIEEYKLDIDTYCEPFSGGFSAGLNLLENGFKGRIILNDLDFEVYNFWNTLKNNWEGLYEQVYKTLKIIELQLDANDQIELDVVSTLLCRLRASSNNVDKATCEYIYRKMLTTKGIVFNIKKYKDIYTDFFIQSETIQDVEIYNLGYKDMLQKYDNSKTLFLIDPPYYMTNIGGYYRCNSDIFSHRELSDAVKKITGKFILTYNNNDYIQELYKDFNNEHIQNNWAQNYSEIYFRNF